MNNQALVKPRVARQLILINQIPAKPAKRLEKFASVGEMVRQIKPVEPVHCLRPHSVETAAKWFIQNFPGDVMYAVKTNPDPAVLKHIYKAGVRHFDVASIAETAQVRALFPDAELYYVHPVKSRESIQHAYYTFGVRTFALDSHEELQKIMDVTHNATDLNLFVRLAIPNEHAAYSLSGKFGMPVEGAAELVKAVREKANRLGLCFHVGSQCMNPEAYRNAMIWVRELLAVTGVKLDVLDVGGGFPSAYPGMTPPPLMSYMDTIRASLKEMNLPEGCQILCEPGRALVAESGSVVVRVDLRKGNMLYINDGTYGALFDAGVPAWQYPVKAFRPNGPAMSEELIPFGFFGPTCDSMDVMKGPFLLPADINEGDWIEVGQLGAYGATMRTKFNGFYSEKLVAVADKPMMSLFGQSDIQ